MEGPSSGGGSGGPAPFLLKTYEMVDDSSTDHIVSWTLTGTSFVVWNPPEFSKILLPTYFKHNNFSSFIRQLNTYGFHKIDPERWEFANEDFVKDKTDLLKNIHRRKPIHSHSHPPVDPERSTLTEEIDRLSRENAELQARLRYQQQQSTTWSQAENLKHRLKSLDERQRTFLNYFEKLFQDPAFVQQLAKKIESMDISAYAKRRRLPQAQDDSHFQLHIDNFTEDTTASRPETMTITFQQDFSDKLRLELSPAVSDRVLVSNSTHSSNEEIGGSPWKLSEDEQIYPQAMNHSLSISPEAIDLTDTGTSLTFQRDSSLPLRPVTNASLGLQPRQKSLLSSEEGDSGLISCQLNLTLASSSLLQPNRADLLAEDASDFGLRSEITSAISSEARAVTMDKDSNEGGGTSLPSSQDSQNYEGGVNNTAQPVQVNDLFWEQFLTERPGTSDDEEEISNDRASPFDERHDDKGVCRGMSKAAKNLRKLSLLSG